MHNFVLGTGILLVLSTFSVLPMSMAGKVLILATGMSLTVALPLESHILHTAIEADDACDGSTSCALKAMQAKASARHAAGGAHDGRRMEDEVTELPGLAFPLVQFAGYVSIYGNVNTRPHGMSDEQLFYWFVGKDGADYNHQPTILWTNGGPGASSLWGFWIENGPFLLKGSSETPLLTPRPHAWNKFANLLIFDHPLGVGLSNVSESNRALPHNAPAGIDQLYQSLLNFFQKHPEISHNPIILAGESYAGTYIPLLAKAILRGNEHHGQHIDLRAMVLGDAWVNPWVQMGSGLEYAFSHGLISERQKLTYRAVPWPQFQAHLADTAGVDTANLAADASADDHQWNLVQKYLNREDVRTAIHAKSGPPMESWSSDIIAQLYSSTVNDNYQETVQELLDRGLKTLVISGLNDAKDCNFLGTQAWLDLLTGEMAGSFHAADPVQWKGGTDRVLGFLQESSDGQLSWVKVLNAGHMAVADQPLLIDLIMEKTLAQARRAEGVWSVLVG